MIKSGIISQVESSWTSTVVFSTKKDRSPRFCIDLRKLSTAVKSEKWSVPSVEEIFDDLRGSRIFSTLDLFKSVGKSR